MPPKDPANQMTTSITPVSTTTTPTPASMTSATTITAGTPVPTYPSPAHAQWAVGQISIDPSLQQQTSQAQTPAATATTSVASTPAAPKPQHAATTPAVASTAQLQYYQNYAHYPYYQQYLAQLAAQTHSQQQSPAHNTSLNQTHAPTPVATPHRPVQAITPAATAASTPVIQAHTPAIATAQTTMPSAANANALDTSDISTLNDALGSAGVDLRAEEESLQRHDTHATHLQPHSSLYLHSRPYEDRSRKQPGKPAFDTRALGTTMRNIGSQHKVIKIPDDSVNYMALALRARLQDLITSMIKASRYRKEAQFDRPASFYEALNNTGSNAMDVDGVKLEGQTPMWSIVVRSDVAKQLAVLERIEREEELRVRRERKERQELAAAHSAALAAQAAGNGSMDGSMLGNGSLGGGNDDMAELGQPKKKKKKEGPGVTARNMSEDVRKKMSNAVATQAAGLGKYAWMTAAANSPSPAPKPKATTAGSTGGAGGSGTPASSWARPYVPKKPQQPTQSAKETEQKAEGEDPNKVVVTLRDAMFVVEKERGHGGGRGAARGWT